MFTVFKKLNVGILFFNFALHGAAGDDASSFSVRVSPAREIMNWASEAYQKVGDIHKAVYFAESFNRRVEILSSVHPLARETCFKVSPDTPVSTILQRLNKKALLQEIIARDETVEKSFDQATSSGWTGLPEHAISFHTPLPLPLSTPQELSSAFASLYKKHKAFFMAGQMHVREKNPKEAFFWLIMDVAFPLARSKEYAQDLLMDVEQPDQYKELMPRVLRLAKSDSFDEAVNLLADTRKSASSVPLLSTEAPGRLIPAHVARAFNRIVPESARSAGVKRERDDEGDGRGVRARHEERS